MCVSIIHAGEHSGDLPHFSFQHPCTPYEQNETWTRGTTKPTHIHTDLLLFNAPVEEIDDGMSSDKSKGDTF